MLLKSYITTIKNATLRRENSVLLKLSKQTLSFVKFLNKRGFIRGYEVAKSRTHVCVLLKLDSFANPAINAGWLISPFKPSRLSVKKKQSLLGGFNVFIDLSSLKVEDKKINSSSCRGFFK